MRRRAALLAALAVCVPLPAHALVGGGEPSGPASLSVSAGLDRCGVLGAEVVCKIDVSYGMLANANRYSASVTRADGSVADYGDIGGGSASLWVPYVGAGTYSVQISAYGRPEKPGGNLPLLGRDSDDAGGADGPRTIHLTTTEDPGTNLEADLPERQGERDAGGEQGGEPPASGCSRKEPPTDPPPPLDLTTAGAAIPAATAAALEAEAALPDSVDCPG